MVPPTETLEGRLQEYIEAGKCPKPGAYPALGSSTNHNSEDGPILPTASPSQPSEIPISWEISGNGEEKGMCGEVRKTVSCPNGHAIGKLDHDGNRELFKFITNSCNRPHCPVCYEQWAARLARRVSDRLIQSMHLYRPYGRGNIKHYVFSPPQDYARELLSTLEGYKKLKAELRTLLKAQGYHGGVIIFHSHRTKNRVRFAPHFHIVGLGRIEANSKDFYAQTGWIYKNKGNRKSVYHTVQYLLSHCGVLTDESITIQHTSWFGELSYNKVVKDADRMVKLAAKLEKAKGIESARYVPHKKVVQVTRVARCPVCMTELRETNEFNGNEGYHFEVAETVLYRLRGPPPPIIREVF